MRTLVIYCQQGALVWVYRQLQLKTWQFRCVADGFSVTHLMDSLEDVQAAHTGILQHSVALRGTFLRAEQWLDLT